MHSNASAKGAAEFGFGTMRFAYLFLFLFLVFLTGCATQQSRPVGERGQAFNYGGLSKIDIGTSRAEDILVLLGQPYLVGLTTETARVTYIYAYLSYGTGRSALIEFEDDGTVATFNSHKDMLGSVGVESFYAGPTGAVWVTSNTNTGKANVGPLANRAAYVTFSDGGTTYLACRPDLFQVATSDLRGLKQQLLSQRESNTAHATP